MREHPPLPSLAQHHRQPRACSAPSRAAQACPCLPSPCAKLQTETGPAKGVPLCAASFTLCIGAAGSALHMPWGAGTAPKAALCCLSVLVWGAGRGKEARREHSVPDLAWQMAVAWHAHPNLGAQNRRVFDACSDSARKEQEGKFSLAAYWSTQKEKHQGMVSGGAGTLSLPFPSPDAALEPVPESPCSWIPSVAAVMFQPRRSWPVALFQPAIGLGWGKSALPESQAVCAECFCCALHSYMQPGQAMRQ